MVLISTLQSLLSRLVLGPLQSLYLYLQGLAVPVFIFAVPVCIYICRAQARSESVNEHSKGASPVVTFESTPLSPHLEGDAEPIERIEIHKDMSPNKTRPNRARQRRMSTTSAERKYAPLTSLHAWDRCVRAFYSSPRVIFATHLVILLSSFHQSSLLLFLFPLMFLLAYSCSP